MPETDELVAVVTLLDSRKSGLLPILVPRWNEIDYGGRRFVYVAVVNDCRPCDQEAFGALVADGPAEGVVFVEAEDLYDRVWDLHRIADMQPGDSYVNIVFLHKMAELRQAGREAALRLEIDGRPADWVYWLDADIDPRSHSFPLLNQVLTATVGPHAPQVVSGLYCTRYGGQDIPRWCGDKAEGRYIRLIPGHQQSSRVAGFGCTLMARDLLESIGWERFADYRRGREERVGDDMTDLGVLGEDVYWFRLAEMLTGLTPLVDNRVRCRHYHTDGAHWIYDEVDDPDQPGTARLRSRYSYTDWRFDLTEAVRNMTEEEWRLPEYDLVVKPGVVAHVSEEVRALLIQRFGSGVAIEVDGEYIAAPDKRAAEGATV